MNSLAFASMPTCYELKSAAYVAGYNDGNADAWNSMKMKFKSTKSPAYKAGYNAGYKAGRNECVAPSIDDFLKQAYEDGHSYGWNDAYYGRGENCEPPYWDLFEGDLQAAYIRAFFCGYEHGFIAGSKPDADVW